MKNNKSKIMLFFISVSLLIISCKNNYNCVCSTTLSESAIIINDTKQKAKEKCNDKENELKATDATFKCVLK
jgi:hypothetical protein